MSTENFSSQVTAHSGWCDISEGRASPFRASVLEEVALEPNLKSWTILPRTTSRSEGRVVGPFVGDSRWLLLDVTPLAAPQLAARLWERLGGRCLRAPVLHSAGQVNSRTPRSEVRAQFFFLLPAHLRAPQVTRPAALMLFT